jgi:hypothetical protein
MLLPCSVYLLIDFLFFAYLKISRRRLTQRRFQTAGTLSLQHYTNDARQYAKKFLRIAVAAS